MSDSSNTEDSFRYDKMVEAALRSVVIRALEEVAETGLFDDHHFYITFRTDHPGVEIPDYLRERYPGEMTIVLQHQFYDLDIRKDGFTVMLKFNNIPERLQIPLSAITIFTDPSVNFALQFQPLADEDIEDYDEDYDDADDGDLDDEPVKSKKSGEVISLDQFRSKDGASKSSQKGSNSDEDEDSEDEDKKPSKKTSKTSKKKPSKKSKDDKDKDEDKDK